MRELLAIFISRGKHKLYVYVLAVSVDSTLVNLIYILHEIAKTLIRNILCWIVTIGVEHMENHRQFISIAIVYRQCVQILIASACCGLIISNGRTAASLKQNSDKRQHYATFPHKYR